MYQFPFLHLRLYSQFVALPKRLEFFRTTCCCYPEGFVQRDVWDLKAPPEAEGPEDRIFIRQYLTAAHRHDKGFRFSGLDIFVVVERKMTFYVLNVLFPV